MQYAGYAHLVNHYGITAIKQAYVPLFSPKHYITGGAEKNPHWRVSFNGLGSLDYCIMVRRTNAFQSLRFNSMSPDQGSPAWRSTHAKSYSPPFSSALW